MSNAEEIKEYYRKFLMDGQQHSTNELFSFVRKNDKDNEKLRKIENCIESIKSTIDDLHDG